MEISSRTCLEHGRSSLGASGHLISGHLWSSLVISGLPGCMCHDLLPSSVFAFFAFLCPSHAFSILFYNVHSFSISCYILLVLFDLICMCLGVQSMDVLQSAYPGMPQSDS